MTKASRLKIEDSAERAVVAGMRVLLAGRLSRGVTSIPPISFQPLHLLSSKLAASSLREMVLHYIYRKVTQGGATKKRLSAFIHSVEALENFDRWAIEQCVDTVHRVPLRVMHFDYNRDGTIKKRIVEWAPDVLWWPIPQQLEAIKKAALFAIDVIDEDKGRHVLHSPVWRISPEYGLVLGLWFLFFQYVRMPALPRKSKLEITTDDPFEEFVECVLQPIRDGFCGPLPKRLRWANPAVQHRARQAIGKVRGMPDPPLSILTVRQRILPVVHRDASAEIHRYLAWAKKQAQAREGQACSDEVAQADDFLARETTPVRRAGRPPKRK
jgi:hypothetical protein